MPFLPNALKAVGERREVIVVVDDLVRVACDDPREPILEPALLLQGIHPEGRRKKIFSSAAAAVAISTARHFPGLLFLPAHFIEDQAVARYRTLGDLSADRASLLEGELVPVLLTPPDLSEADLA